MIGSTISHYRVIEEIGRGGMGVVYKAVDTNLDRTVALKFLPPGLSGDTEAKQRFIQEARSASSLDHQNICTIHEIAEDAEGRVFIAMACYEGQTIRQLIANGSLTIEQVVNYAAQTAEGLAEAHAAGIVHRDIKPGNLMVTDRGVVKILDFGLAKVTDASLTTEGKRFGTIVYMSPEQARGERVTPATDVWSLGAVLYEMLTGARPFDAPYDSAIFYAIINIDPVSPKEHNPDIPDPLQSVVVKCLNKEVPKRYPATGLNHALRELAGESRGSGESSTLQTGPRQKRVSIVSMTILVGVLMILLLSPLRSFLFPSSAPLPAILSLTVLPNASLTERLDDDPFAEGMLHVVSDLASTLSGIHTNVWVVTYRDNIFRSHTTAMEVSNEMYVNLVLYTDVHEIGDEIEITFVLADSRTETELRTERFKMDLREPEEFLKRSAHKLAQVLDISLSRESLAIIASGGTQEPNAFMSYVEGLGRYRRSRVDTGADVLIRHFEQAAEIDSNFALAVSALGSAYWQKFSVSKDSSWAQKARSTLELAVANAPLRPVHHVMLGYVYSQMRRPLDAENAYRRALALDAGHLTATQLLSGLLRSQYRTDEEEATLKAGIEQKPDNWRLYNWLGLFYSNNHRREEAVEQYARVIDLTPLNAWGYNNLAVQYRLLNQNVAAESLFTRVTEIEHASSGARKLAFFNLGDLQYGRDDFEGAVNMFTRSLAIDSTDYKAWENLGNSYHWLGQRDEAIGAWRNSRRLVSTLADSDASPTEKQEVLASVYAKLGMVRDALTALEHRISSGQLVPASLFSLGTTYEIIERRNEAIEYINAAYDAGYDLVIIESSRWLDDLRTDRRFECHFSGDPCQ